MHTTLILYLTPEEAVAHIRYSLENQGLIENAASATVDGIDRDVVVEIPIGPDRIATKRRQRKSRHTTPTSSTEAPTASLSDMWAISKPCLTTQSGVLVEDPEVIMATPKAHVEPEEEATIAEIETAAPTESVMAVPPSTTTLGPRKFIVSLGGNVATPRHTESTTFAIDSNV